MKRSIALGLAATLVATAAHAEDFTITVPVELHNVPAGANPVVGCRVEADRGAGSYDSIPILGIGHAAIDLQGRTDFAGDVTVRFNLMESDGLGVADVTSYTCHLSLVPGDPTGGDVVLTWQRCLEVDINPGQHPFVCGARGARVVGVVQGDI